MTCPLQHICDASSLELLDVSDWAGSDDADLQRRFSDLLRRTLLQQFKPRIQLDFRDLRRR